MFVMHPKLKQRRQELLGIVNKLRENGITDELIIDKLDKLGYDYIHLFRSHNEMCRFLDIDIEKYNGVKWMSYLKA